MHRGSWRTCRQGDSPSLSAGKHSVKTEGENSHNVVVVNTLLPLMPIHMLRAIVPPGKDTSASQCCVVRRYADWHWHLPGEGFIAPGFRVCQQRPEEMLAGATCVASQAGISIPWLVGSGRFLCQGETMTLWRGCSYAEALSSRDARSLAERCGSGFARASGVSCRFSAHLVSRHGPRGCDHRLYDCERQGLLHTMDFLSDAPDDFLSVPVRSAGVSSARDFFCKRATGRSYRSCEGFWREDDAFQQRVGSTLVRVAQYEGQQGPGGLSDVREMSCGQELFNDQIGQSRIFYRSV